MAYKITNQNIYLTRGDSAALDLQVTDEQQQTYDFSEDEVVLTVKRSCTDKKVLIQKTFSDYDSETGKATVVFDPEDTENLPMGDYVYDVQLTHIENAGEENEKIERATIITPHTFTLGAEVTW